MMPMAFNLTFINTISLHSKIFNGSALEIRQLDGEDFDKEIIERCVDVSTEHPNLMEPYFGNV